MTEPRYRYSGRRSPTSNPARASLPVGVGYNPHFSGDIHAVPTARYDAAAPRRVNEHKASSSSNNPPTTTITTYNVTKEPAPRTSNTARRRSSTVDSGAVKPIIVTTNHATRPHGSSSHTSSAARQTSPSHDPYRSSDETYYTQPASSTSRGQRYSHGYSQSATVSNDELRRLRERVGGIDDRLRAPTHTPTDYYRFALPHASYATPSHDLSSTAVIDYENEGYEYTKPSDLARYDLDNDRQPQRGRRRESVDRPANNYFRPTVNVVSNDPGRYDAPSAGRGRGPPPPSSGLERYNRATAAGIYDRPTVTMPALPPVPSAPPVDPKRRIEAAPRDPSPERRLTRPRPVSLYQDAPARISHPDDLYRSHDDERVHRRRERDDPYLDPEVSARGFGIRTDSLKVEQPDRPARSVDRRDYDDRRVRRDAAEREPRRRSDESIDYARPHDTRQSVDDNMSRDSRDSRDTLSRKGSLGGRARDKVAAGLGVAAAAMGLVPPKETSKDDDRKVSPRRRDTIDEEVEVGSSRNGDRYKPRERDVVERVERKPSPREDAPLERRESRKERADSASVSRDRETDRESERERIRERALDREREREEEKERERELDQREREKERDRSRERAERTRQDTEAVLSGSAVVGERDNSPPPSDATGTSRRRQHTSSTFDSTNINDLLDVKAELAAKDNQEKPERSPVGDRTSNKEASPSSSSERQPVDSHEESRGREVVSTSEKQVRVVSPPRDKSEQKPIKGILKAPSAKFPEEENPIREGVAPHKDDKTKKGVPPGARWTKINRKLINPAALEAGKERFEVRDDFVIVLRVLNKEEIQGYATATAQLRAAKRREIEKELGSNHEYDSRDDDDKRPNRRHRREHDDNYEYRRDDDRERHRRHRRDDDSDDDGRGRRAIEYETSTTGRHDVPRHHRSVRERDYDSITTNSDDRR
ncbi:uncharacterized protein GGS22DRAFT_187169 [Annulohypoxylon maeteangense]|uniref:uncharacterized protein n=1 Tax=Annulohypoxylon maeteangense TaxID=1927788 RepID=UPI002007A41E|nr:uncharacterized protein GGS22DRAFT_187169 [Annulohypoxylon maeteangense]KAI0885939.1 hypothetical protein GGS22DRAFT_187169 [Annulohypoxylon maeteangense]